MTHRRPLVHGAAMAALLIAAVLVPLNHLLAQRPAADPLDVDALRAAYSQPPEQWPEATIDPGVDYIELGLLPDVPHPDDNPPSPAKTDLGEKLFWDPRLSATGTMACASCHDPDLGWADGRTVSFGHRRTPLKRNAMSAQNTGHLDRLFWDGRAHSLEELTRLVILNQDELRMEPDEAERRIAAEPEYRKLFAEAFGDEAVTLQRITQAIANFMRANNGGRSSFDAFLRGRSAALSDAAIRGLHLFRTQARCANCHMGPTLSDSRLHVTGLHLHDRPLQDLGLYEHTEDPADAGKFRTPPLRNIAKTAPYMHHGLFESLEVTMRVYNAGVPQPRPRDDGEESDPLRPQQSQLIQPLGLTKSDMADVIAFLESLTEPHRVIRPPQLPGDPHAGPAPAPAPTTQPAP